MLIFISIHEASRYFNVYPSTIFGYIKTANKRPNALRYIFKYRDDYSEWSIYEESDFDKISKFKSKKCKAMCIKTNQVFIADSISKLANMIDVKFATIASKIRRSDTKPINGYIIESHV